jgi:murein tripeptide amidase MpaA
VIDNYKKLAEQYPEAQLREYGTTDVGKPLHLFIISPDKEFDAKKLRAENKTIVLINNGIHPGEPEGIDASLLYAEELLKNTKELKKNLKNVVFCIIPVYNVGGHLNRSAYHRANQPSPELHGYRGNARNLDLNRDFMKLKSQNAQTFVQIFQEWKPQIFLDTHTTDGADYQYVITLIPTQHNKLTPILDSFQTQKLNPYLYEQMAKTSYEMTPYVEPIDYNKGPESGLEQYFDMPKISTGYAALFHSLSYMTENHYLKDYKDRVLSVWQFERILVKFANENSKILIENQKKAMEETEHQKLFAVNYELDTTQYTVFNFKGYEVKMAPSPLTGLNRLEYDRSQPFERPVKVYNTYKATEFIEAPYAYILPQAWPEVIEKLKLNGVQMQRLAKDTLIELTATYIDDYKISSRREQGQNPLYDIKISHKKMPIHCYAGDYMIKMNQPANDYIVQMLEPEGMDSFFKWNFYNEVLEQREYFSSIGFEENAIIYLQKHPELKQEFDEAVQKDSTLAQSHYLQLKYIYNNSEYSEKSYKRLPVYRAETNLNLPVK